MAIDIIKLMAMRAEWQDQEAYTGGRMTDQQRIRMFEGIEDGTECRCPACMGLAYRSFITVSDKPED